MATARIIVIFGIDGTNVARTCKSGSEIVIIIPNKSDKHTISNTFLLCVILEPTFSPMGVMDISAPNVKNIIPTITINAPIKKLNKILGVSGVIEKHSTKTINTIGTTAVTDSFNLLCNFGFQNLNTSPLLLISYVFYYTQNKGTFQLIVKSPFSLLFLYLSNVFIVGKSNTSLIACESVNNIHIRSIPNPIPPVGAIPISSAFMKSSSVVFASSSPAASASS